MGKRVIKLLNYAPTFIKSALLYRIPALFSILEIEPTSCTIMITNRCNLRCLMCRLWREPMGKELTTGDWRRIIEDLGNNGIRNIHFSGGEPLLRKDLTGLVAFSTERGFTVGLTTNGILLGRQALGDLVDAGLRSIALSIDGLNSSYERIRGMPGSFPKVKEAAHLIADMRRKQHIDAYINFTLMKDNIDEFEDVKRFADSICLPVAVCLLDSHSSIFDLEENKKRYWIHEQRDFDRLRHLSGFLKNEKLKRPGSLLLNFPMIKFIEEYFRDPRQRSIPCISSQDRVIIDPYGNLSGGCLSMGNFGNINRRPFGELRKGENYRRAKKNMFYKRCAGCSCGYQFNIKTYPQLVVRDMVERFRYFILKYGDV